MNKRFEPGAAGVAVVDDAEKMDANVEERDFTEEETQSQMRMCEEDFIHGLIEAADFSETETQRIEIARGGRLLFAFRIRPLSSEEYDMCRKTNTKYVRNRQLGMKMADETDRVKYHSALIYQATVEEDRKKLWDNRKVWETLNSKKDRILKGQDVIGCTLKAGEMSKIIEAIDTLSGFDDNLEGVVKN